MRRKPHPYRQGELSLVIDCSDLERSADFWTEVLGYVPEGPAVGLAATADAGTCGWIMH